jgi:hypothetical protein
VKTSSTQGTTTHISKPLVSQIQLVPLLHYGVLPFWGAFRKQPVYRRALPGLNSSAVVGLCTSNQVDP